VTDKVEIISEEASNVGFFVPQALRRKERSAATQACFKTAL